VVEKWGDAGLFEKLGKVMRKTPGTTVRDRARREDSSGKIDGRTLRKTGRTELFSARVTVETKDGLQAYAKEQKLLLGELLEALVAVCEGASLKDSVAQVQRKRRT
jgi:hypothetical protein